MSDFRTLREAMADGVVETDPAKYRQVGKSNLHPSLELMAAVAPFLDLRICGDALVALDVEAGVMELDDYGNDIVLGERGHDTNTDTRTRLLAILTACGVHVPEKPWMQWDGGKGDDGFTYTITIKRKEGE